MKIQKAFSVLIILFVSIQIRFAQESSKAELVDEFGKICSEDLMSRYDGYMVGLHNNPSSIGYIVFYGDKSVEGRNLNLIRYLAEIYPKFRGFDKSRITLVRGTNQSMMKTQFWLVPAGANPPKVEKPFTQEQVSSTTLFDKNWADFHKWYGKLEIYSNGFFENGCEFSPNVDEFAKILLSNEDLTGYLVVYGNKRGRAEKVGKFAVNDLVKNYKVPRNRLKTIYGGKSDEPQIELWFVPKNDKLPIVNTNSK